MKIKPYDLNRQLQKPLKAYWVCGDETLLIEEVVEQLVSRFKKAETEVIRIHVDSSFKEDMITQWVYGGSLFAQEQILLITLGQKSPAAFNTQLPQWLADAPAEMQFIIQGPRLTGAQMQSKWVKTLDPQTGFIQIWPIEKHQLPQWLVQRARQRFQMNLHPSAAHLIAELTEGNLLASSQTLEKLQLEFGSAEITLEQVEQSLSDMTHFSVFSLTESCMTGDKDKSLRILQNLFEKQVEVSMILWALSQEIRLLYRFFEERKNVPVVVLFKKHRVIERRKGPIKSGLQRLSAKRCQRLLQNAAVIDRQMKGVQSGDERQSVMQWVTEVCY